MAEPKKVKDDAELLQAAFDEIAELKRERAELQATQVDAQPDVALEYLKTIANSMGQRMGDTRPKRAINVPFTMTPEREEQIKKIAAKYENKGLQYAFTGNHVTFRKTIKVKSYDKDLEQWIKEDAIKSECITCSADDATINKVIKFMLLS